MKLSAFLFGAFTLKTGRLGNRHAIIPMAGRNWRIMDSIPCTYLGRVLGPGQSALPALPTATPISQEHKHQTISTPQKPNIGKKRSISAGTVAGSLP